jgi:type I restriction enzyme R subunit
MRKNVAEAIRLFTNEQQDWEDLVPQEYSAVKEAFTAAYSELVTAKEELASDPNNIKKKIAQVRAYQKLEKIQRAIKSYEDFEDDFNDTAQNFNEILQSLPEEKGHVENLKVEIREELKNEEREDADDWLKDIEFTSSQRAVHEERIDSFYINQLLDEYQQTTKPADKDALREKIMKEIGSKPAAIQAIYNIILDDIDGNSLTKSWTKYFEDEIDSIIQKSADTLKVPVQSLQTSFNEYRPSNGSVPFINTISETSQLTKDDFEATFNEKYRKRLLVIEQYWKDVIENELTPLKDEL